MPRGSFWRAVLRIELGVQNVDDSVQVLHRRELDGHLALTSAQLNLHAGVELVREGISDVAQTVVVSGARCLAPGGLALEAVGERHRFLRRAHGQTFRHNALSQTFHLRGIRQRQQSASVTGTQYTGRHTSLHQCRKTQQSQRVGDLRAGPPDALRQLLLSGTEFFHQLLVRGRLFQGIQLGAVQVLQQCIPEQVVIGRFPDDRGDGAHPSSLNRPPTALTHDQLIGFRTSVAAGTHDDGLENAKFLHREGQLRQLVLVEHLPWLLAVGVDVRHRQLGEGSSRNGSQVVAVTVHFGGACAVHENTCA